jgi:hypothetical protein
MLQQSLKNYTTGKKTDKGSDEYPFRAIRPEMTEKADKGQP